MNPIVRVPCGIVRAVQLEAVAAMKFLPQNFGDFLRGFLFLKCCRKNHARIIGIAAQPQHMVDQLLRHGHRKSGGRLHVLRINHKRYLFALGWLGYA